MRRRRSHSLLGAALAAIAWAKPEEPPTRDSGNPRPGGVKGTAPNPARQTKAQKKAEKRARRSTTPD